MASRYSPLVTVEVVFAERKYVEGEQQRIEGEKRSVHQLAAPKVSLPLDRFAPLIARLRRVCQRGWGLAPMAMMMGRAFGSAFVVVMRGARPRPRPRPAALAIGAAGAGTGSAGCVADRPLRAVRLLFGLPQRLRFELALLLHRLQLRHLVGRVLRDCGGERGARRVGKSNPGGRDERRVETASGSRTRLRRVATSGHGWRRAGRVRLVLPVPTSVTSPN
eukprot:1178684-Prorocentrum_minimum.AAC.1